MFFTSGSIIIWFSQSQFEKSLLGFGKIETQLLKTLLAVKLWLKDDCLPPVNKCPSDPECSFIDKKSARLP